MKAVLRFLGVFLLSLVFAVSVAIIVILVSADSEALKVNWPVYPFVITAALSVVPLFWIVAKWDEINIDL